MHFLWYATMKEDSDDEKGFGLKEVVHLSVLGWSATILTAGYLNIIKADPTFVASIFTGCLANYGISRTDNSKKKEEPKAPKDKVSVPTTKN